MVAWTTDHNLATSWFIIGYDRRFCRRPIYLYPILIQP